MGRDLHIDVPATSRRSTSARAPGDVLVHLRRARDHVDRHFTERIELDDVAAVAGLSKFHFHRLFTAVYGVTPARYLTQRRIERAQDLLRATNLTVTEICFAVGYSSLGSFSTRFSELVGETPSAFQRRYATSGRSTNSRLLRVHVGTRRTSSALERFRKTGEVVDVVRLVASTSWSTTFLSSACGSRTSRSPRPSTSTSSASRSETTSCSATTSVGARSDILLNPSSTFISQRLGRRCRPNSPTSIIRAQDEGGTFALGISVDDCVATVVDLESKGVEVINQPEERPYGVEALIRDNSGNWIVMVENRDWTPEQIADFVGDDPSSLNPMTSHDRDGTSTDADSLTASRCWPMSRPSGGSSASGSNDSSRPTGKRRRSAMVGACAMSSPTSPSAHGPRLSTSPKECCGTAATLTGWKPSERTPERSSSARTNSSNSCEHTPAPPPMQSEALRVDALIDIIVHGQDIARPLQRTRPTAPDRVSPCARPCTREPVVRSEEARSGTSPCEQPTPTTSPAPASPRSTVPQSISSLWRPAGELDSTPSQAPASTNSGSAWTNQPVSHSR